jgi:formylglycine-generating enzyme required for sulfatase activity
VDGLDGGLATAPDGGPTGEADPASVSGFRLDKYLVTVGRFRQFVEAWKAGWNPSPGDGKHTHLNGGNGVAAAGGSGFEPGWAASDDSNIIPTDGNLACVPPYYTWTPAPGSQESLPMNCATWVEAYAFCIWDGGFLPTEAEFEFAAAGGSQQLEYPWGSADPGTSNDYAIYYCYYPNGSGVCTGVANLAPVGTASKGAGVWGQLDLGGEVFEWALDWNGPYVDPCVDCAQLTASSMYTRITRGGHFGNLSTSSADLSASYRGKAYVLARYADHGFRCARSP